MRTFGKFVLLSLMVLFFCGADEKEDFVVIGVAAPLTGDQAYIGVGMLQGAQMAVEDANAKGPVFGNTKIKLLPLDDQHNPTQAVLVANKIVADPSAIGAVGHFNSSCSKAASSIYYEARLPQVSPASTNPEISKQGFDTFFRVCATDDVQAPAAASFVWSKLGVKKVAVIDDHTTYGEGLANEFEKNFKKLGGAVLRREGITQGEKDFTPLLTKVRAAGPELIFFGGIYPEQALLLKQSRRLGLKVPWMGGDGIFDNALIKLATPELSNGTYATMLGVDPRLLPGAKDFINRYEARYGEIGSFSAYGYDATAVLIDAVRRTGKKDREAVVKALKDTKDFQGVLGAINFDEKGDAVGRSIGVFKVEEGKFVFVEEMKPQEKGRIAESGKWSSEK